MQSRKSCVTLYAALPHARGHCSVGKPGKVGNALAFLLWRGSLFATDVIANALYLYVEIFPSCYVRGNDFSDAYMPGLH